MKPYWLGNLVARLPPYMWVVWTLLVLFFPFNPLCSSAIALGLAVPPHNRTIIEYNTPHACIPHAIQQNGYVTIDSATGKRFFYWYFPSHGLDAAKDPLVLWLSGGPGCSSALGVFYENGPCLLSGTSSTPVANPTSWSLYANMLYIDQPAGTGFSYASPSSYAADETEVANDLVRFLRIFLVQHPELVERNVYIFSENYGGHFVPLFARHLVVANESPRAVGDPPPIRLKGVGIGNGLTDPEAQFRSYPDMLFNYTTSKLGYPLVERTVYTSMQRRLPTCLEAIAQCNEKRGEPGDDSICIAALKLCREITLLPFVETQRNYYDVRRMCTEPPACYDFRALHRYLNDPQVQGALGVHRPWQLCRADIDKTFQFDVLQSYRTDVEYILNHGIDVLIYAGDCDYLYNWIGNRAWTLELDWRGSDAFLNAGDEPFTLPTSGQDAEVVGTMRSADGLSFVKVLNAGHMVPMDQPAVALYLFRNFTAAHRLEEM